jgi:hypothetical protein
VERAGVEVGATMLVSVRLRNHAKVGSQGYNRLVPTEAHHQLLHRVHILGLRERVLESRGGIECESWTGTGGGLCVSCDFFFPNGSQILSLEDLVGCSFTFGSSTIVGRGFSGVNLLEGCS